MITLFDYKRFSSISDTKSDSKISAAVTAANSVVQRYIGNTYSGNSVVVTFDVSEDNEYFIPVCDFDAITSVKLLGQGDVIDEAAETYQDLVLVENKDYYVSDLGIVEIDVQTYYPVTFKRKLVEITYTLPSIVPADLKIAILELTTYYFKREFNYTKEIAGQDIKFNDTNMLPTQIKTILDMHRCL